MLQKNFFLITLFFVFTIGMKGQTRMTRSEYLEKYKDYAIKEMERTGIPASITMAQGMLESGDGNSRLATKGNNHFGIKCHNWKGSHIKHDDDENNECFRKYNSAYESYRDHSDFLVSTPRYAFLFDLDSKDYKAWAKGLKKAGYATSPVYAESLIRIIEENRLYLLDEGVDIKKQDIKVVKSTETKVGKREIFENNRVKYVVAQEGETVESLTKELKLLSWEIRKYNDLSLGEELKSGQSVYIQPKRSKAEPGKKTHIVKEGETIYSISQMYAIKVSSIYSRNDIKNGIQPGQELLLRGRIKKQVIEKPAGEEKKEDTLEIKKTPENRAKPVNDENKDKQEPFIESENEDEMIFELDPE